MKKIRQVKLISREDKVLRRTVAWLDDKKLKKGGKISLKGGSNPDRVWEIDELYNVYTIDDDPIWKTCDIGYKLHS